jgi:hypothetical protein
VVIYPNVHPPPLLGVPSVSAYSFNIHHHAPPNRMSRLPYSTPSTVWPPFQFILFSGYFKCDSAYTWT